MNNSFDGFVPIHGIFYSVFHPTEGTKVSYEFPPSNLVKSGINFDAIKNYVIPKPQLCHKLLTLKYNNYRIVGYPIIINSSLYARNNFSFNLVFVFPYECETSPYEPVVERLGKMFCELEGQCQFLSKCEKDMAYFDFKLISNLIDQDKSNTEPDNNILSKTNSMILPTISNIDTTVGSTNTQDKANSKEVEYLFSKYNVIQNYIKNDKMQLSMNDILMRVFQDLNSYSECYIPIDDGNAIDIKLFPTLMPPIDSISVEDVPIPTVNLNKIIDVNWDPTMLKIVPYIDGLNSIFKIANLSNSDAMLVIECIRHFVYYGCVILSDIFQFSNIYAPTSSITDFLTDPTLATECQIYVTSPEDSLLSALPFKKGRKMVKNRRSASIASHFTSSSSLRQNLNSKASSFISDEGHHNDDTAYPNHDSIYENRRRSESSFSSGNNDEMHQNRNYLPTKSTLFDLYRSLSQGVKLEEWYQINFNSIRDNFIDIRRFIIFGIIKRIIYRCHSYPLPKNYEAFSKLNDLKNLQNGPKIVKNKSQSYTYNIFSTSDIKFGVDLYTDTKKKLHTLDVDVADRVLNNVYKKLSTNGRPTTSINGQGQHPSKVAFKNQSYDNDLPGLMNNLGIEATKFSREININDKIYLLDALQSAENLDNICSNLELSREEVETLLNELTEYRIINC
ncbi:hypothetical protein TPHA_0J00310 [Tetrapisispora phaffii CBS 4417]|uniref:Nitrogen permease regulator 2 n=1 Tax=Tetrapisispora phaffii (strain ATCC 24235 / CBS 4417 / NBRC 1672 / NRRL Y-8282 / UCD 70-5) TaxID=1071381 RepID=G8BYB2_TETPH|nr:hypothetical protein TPHA_0J00310 [Tetrapisispora phaffii CBS 4417]CCE64854.1 hypothetical protein TPHA_0J00310 [Tetrapisispora phaffii CBS 4417]